jgi:hypothetical protein
MIGQPFWIDLETCQGLHAGSRAPGGCSEQPPSKSVVKCMLKYFEFGVRVLV